MKQVSALKNPNKNKTGMERKKVKCTPSNKSFLEAVFSD